MAAWSAFVSAVSYRIDGGQRPTRSVASLIAESGLVSDAGRVALRCLIVDDNEAFLAFASRVLESQGMSVVGRALTSREALHLSERLRPDVVLVDVQLGEEKGIDLARRFAELPWSTPVVLISTHSEDDLAELLADSPAAGFLPKRALSAAAIADLLG
jgi:two-component system nitrate/nitrite response regulator NarL